MSFTASLEDARRNRTLRRRDRQRTRRARERHRAPPPSRAGAGGAGGLPSLLDGGGRGGITRDSGARLHAVRRGPQRARAVRELAEPRAGDRPVQPRARARPPVRPRRRRPRRGVLPAVPQREAARARLPRRAAHGARARARRASLRPVADARHDPRRHRPRGAGARRFPEERSTATRAARRSSASAASPSSGSRVSRRRRPSYRKAVELQPQSWSAQNYLGAFLVDRNRAAEGEAAFRRALELAPDNVRALANLGGALYYQDRLREAEATWTRALERRAVAGGRLATSAPLAVLQEALHARRRGRSRRPSPPATRDYRVWRNLAAALYWAPGEREKAADAYRQAATLAEQERRLDPKDARVLAQLADCYAMLGDTREGPPARRRGRRPRPRGPAGGVDPRRRLRVRGGPRRRPALAGRRVRARLSPERRRQRPHVREAAQGPALAEAWRGPRTTDDRRSHDRIDDARDDPSRSPRGSSGSRSARRASP